MKETIGRKSNRRINMERRNKKEDSIKR